MAIRASYDPGDHALHIFDPITRGGRHVENVTKVLKKYRRSTRDQGGPWQGSARYDAPLEQAKHFFKTGLMADFQEIVGGAISWRGFISRMELVENGVKLVRDYGGMYNTYRSIYSSIGENKFANGSLELGLTWTPDPDIGPPIIHALIGPDVWVIDGVNALELQVGPSQGFGSIIESGIAITSGVAYDVSLNVRNLQGSWFYVVYMDNPPGSNIAQNTFTALGDQVWTLHVDASQPYTGPVSVRIEKASANCHLYADNAVFTTSPFKSETAWITNDVSIDRWGRKEQVYLRGVMTTESAIDEITTDLNYTVWPWVSPPQRQIINQFDALRTTQKDGLTIFFSGYAFLLNNLHALVGLGTQAINVHMNSIIDQTPFITPGVITANPQNYKPDDRAPRTLWALALDMARKGDAAGNRYTIEVDTGLQFHYIPTETTTRYTLREGRILSIDEGAINPWTYAPGWHELKGGPNLTIPVSTAHESNLDRFFASETELYRTDNRDNPIILSFTQEQRR